MTKDTGGPAFPTEHYLKPQSIGGFAEVEHSGMTLRDWFAGQALGTVLLGMASTDHEFIKDLSNGTRGGRFVATAVYQIADAMIAERSK